MLSWADAALAAVLFAFVTATVPAGVIEVFWLVAVVAMLVAVVAWLVAVAALFVAVLLLMYTFLQAASLTVP
jgi:hypothetical protein